MNDVKKLIRIAGNVQDALAGLKRNRYLEQIRRFASLTSCFQRMAAESRKMSKALSRGWLRAAKQCGDNAVRLLGDLSSSMSQVQQLTGGPKRDIPPLSTIIDELNGVRDEFGDLAVDEAKNTVSVVTEPITLEGIYLGPFQIKLELNHLSELDSASPYRAIALEPNPAATENEVTHPHVSSQKVCEGDGSAAIKASLAQGRLGDFFTLVRSILNTYNPEAPYVSLQDWEGTVCYDCGCTMTSEETYYFPYCEYDYCSYCAICCPHCGETACLGCSSRCSYCEESVCRSCISGCEECGELFCSSCLENNHCPNCREESEKDHEPQPTETKTCEGTNPTEAKTAQVRLAG